MFSVKKQGMNKAYTRTDESREASTAKLSIALVISPTAHVSKKLCPTRN